MSEANLDLAVIGNGRTAALVEPSGRIVWWCMPRYDGDPVFCRLLAGNEDKGFTDVVLDRQVEIGLAHDRLAYLRVASCSKARRTSIGEPKTAAAPSKCRPTEKPLPPNSNKAANTDSSVTSSPINTGVRPANGK